MSRHVCPRTPAMSWWQSRHRRPNWAATTHAPPQQGANQGAAAAAVSLALVVAVAHTQTVKVGGAHFTRDQSCTKDRHSAAAQASRTQGLILSRSQLLRSLVTSATLRGPRHMANSAVSAQLEARTGRRPQWHHEQFTGRAAWAPADSSIMQAASATAPAAAANHVTGVAAWALADSNSTQAVAATAPAAARHGYHIIAT